MHEEIKPEKPVWLSALGYFMVSLVCFFAGLTFAGQKIEENFLKLLALIPFYFFYLFWVVVYDSRNPHSQNINIKYVHFTGFYWVSVASFTLISYLVEKKFKFEIVTITLLSQVPFFILSLYLLKVVNKKFEGLTFRTFIFFPALCTCLIPFIIGYAKPMMWIYFAVFISSVVVFYYLNKSYRYYKGTLVFALLIYLVIYIFSLRAYDAIYLNGNLIISKKILDFLRALCIGITMSIILGLTESWWFLKDPKNQSFTAENAGRDFYIKWVDYATRFFPFLVPILILNNSFNIAILLLIVLTAYLLNFYEKNFSTIDDGNYWRKTRVYLGLGIAICFVLSTIQSSAFNIKHVFFLSSFNFIVITFIAISMGLLTILRNSTEQSDITNLFTPQKLITILICVTFFIISHSVEYLTSTSKIPFKYTSQNLPPKEIILNDTFENNDEIIENYFIFYSLDSNKKSYLRQNGLLIGFSQKNNTELNNRAGISKLIYGLLFIWVILIAPIKHLISKAIK